MADALPLPLFVSQFLAKRGVRISLDPQRRNESVIRNTNTLGHAIESLVAARTFQAIGSACGSFIRMVTNSPPLLQREHEQFLFPFFVHLALQLYQLKKFEEGDRFVQAFRPVQPHECQAMIDRLQLEKESFVPPHFDIEISQFALDDLMRAIESRKQALLSFIITTQINLRIAPPHHRFLFAAVTDSAGADSPIL
jgi:hypothetical protein